MVLPLKDTMPAARAPVVTLALVAVSALVFAVVGEGGWIGPGGVLMAALALLVLWIFGATLEDTLGRVAYAVLFGLGAAVAVTVVALSSGGASAAIAGASGAVSAVLGAYVALYPRGRVLSAAFVVLFFTMLELPALLLAALWWAAHIGVVALAGADAVTVLAPLGGFGLGLAAARLLARPKPIAPAPYRIA